MRILAIDPGPVWSAFLVFDNGKPTSIFGKWESHTLCHAIANGVHDVDFIAIEMIASYGMPVGKEIFDTCVWIGRMMEAATYPVKLIYRKDVKLHLCGSPRAKDSNIRQALIDRFGPPGTKKSPGATYGISGDVWAALAVATTASDERH